MAYFDPNTTVDSKARDTSVIPVQEGRFLMTTDTRNIFYDTGDSRIQLTDILDLETEQERQGLLAPVNKFYFVKDTGVLWRYSNGSWIKWSSGGGSGGASEVYTATLTASGWADGKQRVAIDGMSGTQNGVVGMAQSISEAALEAVGNGGLYVCGQETGAFTIAYGGDKPECDIPIALILFPS